MLGSLDKQMPGQSANTFSGDLKQLNPPYINISILQLFIYQRTSLDNLSECTPAPAPPLDLISIKTQYKLNALEEISADSTLTKKSPIFKLFPLLLLIFPSYTVVCSFQLFLQPHVATVSSLCYLRTGEGGGGSC